MPLCEVLDIETRKTLFVLWSSISNSARHYVGYSKMGLCPEMNVVGEKKALEVPFICWTLWDRSVGHTNVNEVLWWLWPGQVASVLAIPVWGHHTWEAVPGLLLHHSSTVCAQEDILGELCISNTLVNTVIQVSRSRNYCLILSTWKWNVRGRMLLYSQLPGRIAGINWRSSDRDIEESWLWP